MSAEPPPRQVYEDLKNDLLQRLHRAEEIHCQALKRYKDAIKKYRNMPNHSGVFVALHQTAAAEAVAVKKYASALRAFTDLAADQLQPEVDWE